MKRVCIQCGSNFGVLPEYRSAAHQLGKTLALKGFEVVYGGGNAGLMGAVAEGALEVGGKVIGVIPKAIAEKLDALPISENHIVEDMHERKSLMFELSDAFIALPGGFGTLEEILEILTWAQLGYHGKPAGILNVCNYFDKLIEFLSQSVSQGFIKATHFEMLQIGNSVEELLEKFRVYQAPQEDKWLYR